MPSNIFIDAINNVSPKTEAKIRLFVESVIRLSQLIEQKR